MRLRSLLFVPAHRARFYEKLVEFRPDAVILDLEDAVAPTEKSEARNVAAANIGSSSLDWIPTFVRVNQIDSAHFVDDIRAIVRPGLHGIVLPKCESAQQARGAHMLISQCEMRAGLPIGSVSLVPVIETIRGLFNASEICESTRRVLGVGFGSEDFTLDLGVPRSPDGLESLYPRAQLALVARAAGIAAIDTPWTAIDDTRGLQHEAAQARQLGFSGKQAIHPSQIGVINECFSPSAAEVAWARRVVDAYDEAIAKGVGAINLDGKLIDVPMVERARNLLALAAD
jgi:citrate lyase subunit beta/citryl-CoA lyase